ncbi:MAG: ABC transporter ATP-binding protein [Leptolyngbyaceae cyanobacterium MO_188.B28]|nr:ABC transporter ATP-binding protein [Leptolyngbyaceae cyanobacterium MO_188.B28]
MSEIILDVRNLKVHFQTDTGLIKAVNDTSFQVKRGQTLGIVGESGSGKSVTSLAVMRLVPSPPGKIVGGEIWFQDDPSHPGAPASQWKNGQPADRKSAETAPRSSQPVNLAALPKSQMQHYRGGKIAMIFQEPMSSLNPVYTCGFQLTEAIRQHQDVSPAEARRQAIARLQEVKLLPSDDDLKATLAANGYRDERQIIQEMNRRKQAMLNRYPHELSGGQIQRVMIAMAISSNPALLIADEPTTALDVTVQANILDLLRELRDRRGMSMIFITHDLGTIAEIADQVAVMYQGHIVEYGSVWEIFSNPQNPYTKGLLACRPRPDQKLRFLPTVSDFMEVSTAPSGEQIIQEKSLESTQNLQAKAQLAEGESQDRLAHLEQEGPLLTVEDLKVAFPIRGVLGRTKRYVMAVNGVSFSVYRGETFGLVGESGCGKTTLGRALLQLVKSMSGRVIFEGIDLDTLSAKQLRQRRRDMQIIFQDPFSSLNPRMSIGRAISEPLKIHGIEKSRRNRRERVAYLLERVDLNPDCMNRFPHEFSGGQRQRICIARALALNPKFIICDESVSALDVSVQAQVLNLLKELQAEFGLTYIFISHDLSVVEFMSDRIMVMNRGKVEEIGPAEQIYHSPQEEYTRQLIQSIPAGSLDRIKELQTSRSIA